VDLAYLREHPGNVTRLIEHQRIRSTPIRQGDTCVAERLTLDNGTDLFAKTRPGAPEDFFPTEAAGLRWLRAADAVRVPDVIAATPQILLLEWIEPGPPTPDAAEELGRGLAALHRSGADAFGAPWPGYIGRLPMDNTQGPNWPEFYVEQRCRPFLRLAADRGTFDAAQVAIVERALDRVEADGEPPSRIHGDLWSGNLHFGRDGNAWLVDPAAHGGHRETDLAMLSLFGAPHLDRILASYDEAYPLADGWRDRVPLHQLHPLLVHAALFGAGYASQALAAARVIGGGDPRASR
jgi:fructosamine-3-kinase